MYKELVERLQKMYTLCAWDELKDASDAIEKLLSENIQLKRRIVFWDKNTFGKLRAELDHLRHERDQAVEELHRNVNIIFMAIFLGYSIGSAPIVSYHYGAENHTELKSMFRKSLILLTVSGVILVVLSELVARPLVMIFTSYDPELLDMTASGFQLYALAFLPMGFNVWGSAFFTALNNGAVSACISFLRTLVFQIIVVLTLPILLGIDGIWLSIVAAELLSLAVTVSFLLVKRKRYQYA